MDKINLYATLDEYKAYATARGQTASEDHADDDVILSLLHWASRYLDDKTVRQYYPSVETVSYDVPDDEELLFDHDVLEIISLTNGDDTAITSASYVLIPSGITPYYSLVLKDTASVSWEADSNSNLLQVIDLVAICGYREKYSQRGWQSVGTLGAAISSTTASTFTMTAGHEIESGHILKIDNEIMNTSVVSSVTITPYSRGDNGSTAATHDNGATVYKWNPQEQAVETVLELANSAYQRRFGKSPGETVTVTAAGVVAVPRDFPRIADEFVKTFLRCVS